MICPDASWQGSDHMKLNLRLRDNVVSPEVFELLFPVQGIGSQNRDAGMVTPLIVQVVGEPRFQSCKSFDSSWANGS